MQLLHLLLSSMKHQHDQKAAVLANAAILSHLKVYRDQFWVTG